MNGPWEKFQSTPQPSQSSQDQEGPWTKFKQSAPVSDDLWGRLETQESGGNQSAVSPKGAIGVAQVMPGTAPEAAALAGLPFDESAYKGDADYNRKLGQAYLRKQQDTFGDTRLALAAYNAGPGKVAQTLEKVGDPRNGQVSWDKFMDAMPEETRNYVRKINGTWSVKDGAVQDVKEGGRIAASGIKSGLGSIPQGLSAGLKSASDWGSYAEDKLGIPGVPGLQDLPAPTELLKEATDYLFKPREYEVPQTEEGKGAARILGSAIAGAVSPGSLATNLSLGTAAGIGSEVGAKAGQQFGPNGEQIGAVVGSLAGGLAPGVLEKAGSIGGKFIGANPKGRLASDALDGVSDLQLQIAKERMIQAREQGVNLTLAQATPDQTGIDELQDLLVKTRAGGPLAAQLRAQPGEIANASEAALKTLPGQAKGTQEIANQSQKAADEALQVLRQERTAATKPLYEQAGDMPVDSVRKLALQLKREAKKYPNTDAGRRLDDLANSLYTEKPLFNPAGEQIEVKKVPITNMNQLNGILGDAKSDLGRITNTKPQADRRTSGILSEQIGKIKQQMADSSDEFRLAEQTYAKMSKDIVDPAKQGPLWTVAQKSGYDPSNPASRTNLYGIFNRGTATGGQSDILTLQRDMAKSKDGKQAFIDGVASWFGDKLNKASRSEGGELKPDLAKNIEATFFGTGDQRRGVEDMLAGVAKAQGVDESTIVKGMENWAQTVKLAAKRPSSAQGTSAQEIQEGTKTGFAKAAGINVITPLRGTFRKIDESINKNAYAHISKLLQTPEGIETLKKLARVKPGSFTSQTLLSRFNSTIQAEQSSAEEE